MSDDIPSQGITTTEEPPSERKTWRVFSRRARQARDQEAIGTSRVARPNGSAGEPQVGAQEHLPTRRVERAAPGHGANDAGSGTAAAAVDAAIRHRLGAPLGELATGSVICGDCTVITTRHNHESGKPGLYECQAPEGHVMVKVAATEHPPQPQLWAKLTALRHPNVLRTFRTLEKDGLFFEVQEFCGSGTLADTMSVGRPDRIASRVRLLERALIPAFVEGISYLHENGIVHRDIKPSNLYLREEEGKLTLVIGDFDISAVLETDRTSRATDRAAGTWNYSPPEAFPRFVDDQAVRVGGAVTRSSDYYSYGVVLVELLTGTTTLHQAQLPDLFDFYLQGGRIAVPDGLPDRLGELLHGLLLRNRYLRWGTPEVRRWLRGETTASDRERIREDSGYQLNRTTRPYNVFAARPTNLHQLSAAMAQEPYLALEELMERDVLVNWIGELDASVARKIGKDRDIYRSRPDAVLLRAIWHCDPGRPMHIGPGFEADTAAEWARQAAAAVAAGAVEATNLCDHDGLFKLATWLRLKSAPEPEMAEAVVAIRIGLEATSLGSHHHLHDAPSFNALRRGRSDSLQSATISERIERLIVWRLAQAETINVPPEQLISSHKLTEIARLMPKDIVELSHICGFDQTTLEKYGAAIMDVLYTSREVQPVVEPIDSPAPMARPGAIAEVVLEELRWAMLPNEPYTVAPGVQARNPRELVRLTYGQPGDWNKGCPPVYATSLERWKLGYLQGWLRQRMKAPDGTPSVLVTQCDGLREKFEDRPVAGFETTLRMLDPELPPVQVQINAKSVAKGIRAIYGESITRKLPYRTIGAGMPYGALRLKSPVQGLQIDTHELTKREGTIEVRLETIHDIPAGQLFHARLSLVSRCAQLVPEKVAIGFSVNFSSLDTLRRVAVGAALGAVIFGSARLAAMIWIPQAVSVYDVALFARPTGILLYLVLVAMGYGAFRVWLWALRNLGR